VIALGHSAGAHLALWTAARAKLAPTSELFRASPLPLRGVVALGGPADLRSLQGLDSICGWGTLEQLAGGTLEAVPEHYAQVSPAALLPLGVPVLLVTGSADRLVPTRLLAPYQSAAHGAGDRVELSEVPGASHRDLIVPDSDAWPVVRKGVLELLGR
jgi:pimeloyl-ACP methyl ester carboxylesterase